MMKELALIYKECGWYSVVFYVLYKAELRLKRSRFLKNKSIKKRQRIEKIYSTLLMLDNDVTQIEGSRFISRTTPTIHGVSFKLRVFSSDEKVFEQVIEAGEYKSVIGIYKQLFTLPPKQIFDCGANIGLASVYFHHYFSEATFTVIEPFKENTRSILLNFKAANLRNYNLLEGGVWNRNTPLEIHREFRDRKEWSIQLRETLDSTNAVQGYSLSRLIESVKQVDILKIDIEGAEVKLFEDSAYAASFLKRVRCLAIEIHDEFGIRPGIYKSLAENNFFYFNTNELTIGINRNYL